MVVSVSKHNTPALRFDGFDGEWNHRELNEIGTKSTVKNIDAGLTETFTNSAQYGIISQLEYFDNAVSNPVNISKYSVVEPDDFVYNPRISVTAPFGPINRNRLSRSGAMSPLYLVFKIFGVDHGFLEQFFKTDRWYDFMHLNGDVGARHDRFSIGDAKFMEMEIPTPSLQEQRAIGELFSDLDTLIDQHRAKHTNLQQTKTALMQRMFPQNGADEPELRLDGFSGEWQPRIMRDCAEYSKGSGYSKKDIADEGVPVIHYGRLYTKYETAITNVDTFATPQLGSLISRGDEVLVPASGETAEDIAIASALLQPGVLIGGDLNVIRPRKDIDPVFIALSLSNGVAKETLVKRAQGKSVVHLRNSDIQDVEIFFPALEEQRDIGEVFTNLDSLIAAEQRYITQLTQAKTALLQRMFV